MTLDIIQSLLFRFLSQYDVPIHFLNGTFQRLYSIISLINYSPLLGRKMNTFLLWVIDEIMWVEVFCGPIQS